MRVETRSRRPRWWFVAVVLLGAVALTLGGWFAALYFVSPEQRAATATAPPAQPVLASAVIGDLVDVRVLPAQVSAVAEQTLAIPAQDEHPRSVVTEVLSEVGASLSELSPVLEVNGHPVFVLESPFPFYRDLRLGDEGPDVRVLQENLVAAGHLSKAGESLGAETVQALEALYATVDRRPPLRPDSSGGGDGAAEGGQGYLPLTAVMTSESLPALVETIPAKGALVGPESTLSLAAGGLQVTALVPDSLRADMAAGLEAQVTLPDGSRIPAQTGEVLLGQGADTQVALVPEDPRAIEGVGVGQPVSAQVTLRILAEKALIVPLTAVSTQADGQSVVLVAQSDGSLVRTPVHLIASHAGSVAIKPGEGLEAGDKVQVG